MVIEKGCKQCIHESVCSLKESYKAVCDGIMELNIMHGDNKKGVEYRKISEFEHFRADIVCLEFQLKYIENPLLNGDQNII